MQAISLTGPSKPYHSRAPAYSLISSAVEQKKVQFANQNKEHVGMKQKVSRSPSGKQFSPSAMY